MTNRHYIVLKPATMARFFIYFNYKMSTKIHYICIKYSTPDLICDVTTSCVWSL